MAQYTLTYSPRSKGWTSFFSYYPDWMVGLNTYLYSFKDGDIYKHNVNPVRNNFYGVQYNSTIQTIFNENPIQAKMFKTIEIEGNSTWEADMQTDLNTGFIDPGFYLKKEGAWYSYIRRYENEFNIDLISAQGIGPAVTVTPLPPLGPPYTVTFANPIDSMLSDGDILFIGNSTTADPLIVGIITSHTTTSVTVTALAPPPVGLVGTAPQPGDFMLYMKSSIAESYGIRGYYLDVLLTNTESTQVEMFAVTSDVFKSYP